MAKFDFKETVNNLPADRTVRSHTKGVKEQKRAIGDLFKYLETMSDEVRLNSANFGMRAEGVFPLDFLVRQKRKERGLTLEQLADAAGSSKSHIWSIEKGNFRNPTVGMLYGISIALGVPFIELAESAIESLRRKEKVQKERKGSLTDQREIVLDSFGEFTWNFGNNFYVVTSVGWFIWSNPYYGGDNSFVQTSITVSDFFEDHFGRHKGRHKIRDYCGDDIKITLIGEDRL